VRTEFVMALVNLARQIENIESPSIRRDILKDCYIDLVRRADLTAKEHQLLDFECQQKGI
jgi:hypothetical protein